jgi:chlorite dismutase
MAEEIKTLVPLEGWHVFHLYYSIDHSQWSILSEQEQREAKTQLTELVQEIRSHKDTQLLTFAVATPKADIGFMLITPDLQDANAFEKRLSLSLGIDILHPVYSYLSQTERSEYTTSTEQYAKETLIAQQGLEEGSEEYEKAIEEFETRMEHYVQHRLYPILPEWPIICFYPMSKRRLGQDNWFSLEYETRRKLMGGHAKTGRQYSGKILQLISGSTGLDEHEWGVTLLAHDTFYIKEIVYKMRFDEVSAKYGEFGDFYIGMNLQLNDLFERICL